MVTTNKYIYSLKPTFHQNSFSEREMDEFEIWIERELVKQLDALSDEYPYLSNNQKMHFGYKNIFDKIGWEYGRKKRTRISI